jgi:hypothetical protein
MRLESPNAKRFAYESLFPSIHRPAGALPLLERKRKDEAGWSENRDRTKTDNDK